MVSCFKDKFPVVTPPDDIAGDSATTAPGYENVQRKVLIIGMGGCRGETLQNADIPNIKALFPHSIYSFDALTEAPTLGAPGWSSLLTGVWGNKHGVKDNSYASENFTRYPVIFKYLKQINGQLKIISVSSSNAINDKLMMNADVKISTNGNDILTKDSAVARLKDDNPDVMFVNFEDANEAGKAFGYDSSVPQYMKALTSVDGYVAEVMKAMDQRSQIAKEDWLVIITTDHGGTLNGHGGDSYSEKNIFTVFYNKMFNAREVIPPSSTLKSIYFPNIDQYAYIKDTTHSGFLDFDSYPGFTVQLNVKCGDHLTAYDSFLGNKNWFSGMNPGWVMAVEGQGWKLNVGDGSHRADANSNAPPLNDSKWHKIAITVDKKGGVVNLYQDDTLYNTTSIVTITSWNNNSDIKLNSGDDITGTLSKAYGNSPFNVANIHIWDTVLTVDDMREYSACDTTARPNDPFENNIVGWWKAIDGNGAKLKDYGPHQVDMQLNGTPLWVQQQIDFCNTPLPPSVPTIVDIAPAVLKWMHISTDPGWGLDGKSWLP